MTDQRRPRMDDATRLRILAILARSIPPGCRLRTGGKVERNLYLEGPEIPGGGVDIGSMATASLARLVVQAVNTQLESERLKAATRDLPDFDENISGEVEHG